jgi:hypothetical protein
MNVAVALVRSRRQDGTIDLARLRQHLERLVPLAAGLGWAEEPLALPTDTRGRETLMLFAAQLQQAQTLDEMRESGRASLLLLTDAELERALRDVPVSNVPPSDHWLEADSLSGGRWVVYPQDEAPEHRVMVWLPVASGPGTTRLVALDTGVDLSTGEVQAPSAPSSPCDVGFSGYGERLRQVCISGDCTGDCKERWRYRRGDFELVSCPCR